MRLVFIIFAAIVHGGVALDDIRFNLFLVCFEEFCDDSGVLGFPSNTYVSLLIGKHQ